MSRKTDQYGDEGSQWFEWLFFLVLGPFAVVTIDLTYYAITGQQVSMPLGFAEIGPMLFVYPETPGTVLVTVIFVGLFVRFLRGEPID